MLLVWQTLLLSCPTSGKTAGWSATGSYLWPGQPLRQSVAHGMVLVAGGQTGSILPEERQLYRDTTLSRRYG